MMGMMPMSHRQMAAMFMTWFVGIAELLLAFRVVLKFFNGNPDATFVHWVYTNTAVLMEPFRAVFTSTVTGRGWNVDFVALFAMGVYAAVAAMLMGYVYAAKEK